VISPQLQSLKQSGDLPFASSLCGACRTACPVDINLPDLLLALRAKAKESGAGRTLSESAAMRGIAFAARHPRLFTMGGRLMRTLARLLARDGKIKSAPMAPLSDWTRYRDLPAPGGRSFRERWKKDRND
jgi:L-lactate dehydrogenase complex protein LldF